MFVVRLIAKIFATVLLAAFVLPWLWQLTTGDYFMTVTGRSMEPTYEVGDVLVVEQPTGDDLGKVGNIVVVAFTPGDKESQYVHRVEKITDRGVRLKGDGNEVSDPGLVHQANVMGTPRYRVTGSVADAYRFSQSIGGRVIAALIILPIFAIRLKKRPGRHAQVMAVLTGETPVPETFRPDLVSPQTDPFDRLLLDAKPSGDAPSTSEKENSHA